jgi:hypothetical protein
MHTPNSKLPNVFLWNVAISVSFFFYAQRYPAVDHSTHKKLQTDSEILIINKL